MDTRYSLLLRHVIELWNEESKIGLRILDFVLLISIVHFITNEPISIRSIQSTTSSVSKLHLKNKRMLRMLIPLQHIIISTLPLLIMLTIIRNFNDEGDM